MNLSFDTVVAGAGLAGAFAAFVLSARERVLILGGSGRQTGASAVPVGLVSPLMSRRARPVWRMEEAVESLTVLLGEAGAEDCFERNGVLKPAVDSVQAEAFRDAAVRWPRHGVWLEGQDAATLFPAVRAEHGLLHVVSGGAIDMPGLCRKLVDAAVRRGATFDPEARLMGWRELRRAVEVSVSRSRESRIDDAGEAPVGDLRPARESRSAAGTHAVGYPVTEKFMTGRLVVAVGSAYRDFPGLSALRLHPIKGQWIRIVPHSFEGMTAPVSAHRYVAAHAGTFIVAGTYEHDFNHERTTQAAARLLMQDAAGLIPSLAGARLLDSGAALRVTVPEIRLPMIGPLPGMRRTWIISGLGSKGLLMAPLIARELPEFFTEAKEIPRQIRVI